MVGSLMLLKLLQHTRKCRYDDEKIANKSKDKVVNQLTNLGTSNNLIAPKHEFMKTKSCKDEQKICRVCLKEGVILIFGGKECSTTSNLTEALKLFGGLDVHVDDVYPKYLCDKCHTFLLSAILFRETAQKSDQFLKQSTQKSVTTNNEEMLVKKEHRESHTYEFEEDIEFKEEYKQSKENPNGKEYSTHGCKEEKTTAVTKEFKSYHCLKCNLSFENITEYKEHKNMKITCSICNKSYEHSYMKIHRALHDTQIRLQNSYMCDICGKLCHRKGWFTRHRETHFYSLPYKCSLCPYKGRFPDTLKAHMRTHTGEKPFQCTECSYRSSCKSNLNKHMAIHRDKQFKCNLCEHVFSTKRNLEVHLKHSHMGIKEHVCDICNKAFSSRNKMNFHQIRIHKREKRRSGLTPLYLQAQTKE
ncbi:zinc finger protein 761-like [Galleria mellonella]|uniref:Zinc finger protein 761-like n=1 Tax=Galleria mellonella TaxID=7137 RepID=A0A6J1WQ69_GALME|nr:zinc finger protein 761-like [Galleria mellonella]